MCPWFQATDKAQIIYHAKDMAISASARHFVNVFIMHDVNQMTIRGEKPVIHFNLMFSFIFIAITINDTFCQHLVHSGKSISWKKKTFVDESLPWNFPLMNLNASVVGNYVRTRDSVQQEDSLVWLAAVQESCNNLTFLNKTDEYANGDNPWEFSSALFLCMTILTTVGITEI